MNEYIEIAKKIFLRYNDKLSPESLEKLAGILEPMKYKKGEVILDKGQILRSILYIDTGLIRQFYYKKEKDVTEHFGCAGTTVYCIHSLFGQEPTELMIEAIIPTFTYNINYRKLCDLIDSYSDIANAYKHLMESDLRISQRKADSWRFETTRERYNRFIKDFPDAARLASINDIASYLLMAPESLSRVRSGIL